MPDANPRLIQMLSDVANALGNELRSRMVFVGGATTGLFVTDDFTREQVRLTDDVDLIVDIMGQGRWVQLQGELRQRGFRISAEDDVTCRMRLGELKVDFMPDDANILGFTNRWYARGIETSVEHLLAPELPIKILTPALFVATKLEAYLGRGNQDPMTSNDLEDIIILLDGRRELTSEIMEAEADIRGYIAFQFEMLRANEQFVATVESNVRGDADRAKLVFERMTQACKIAEA